MSKNTTYAKNMQEFCEARKRYNKKYYKRTAIYKKRAWTKEEDELVLKHSITDTELSDLIRRSVRSIQIRRSRLKNKSKKLVEKPHLVLV